VPWVKSGELKETIVLNTSEKITLAATKETNAHIVPKNAVLIAMYGATVGETAILGIDAATNQAVCHVIPDPNTAHFRFVWYALKSRLDEFLSKRVGGAQPNINQGIIRNTIVPVPPLAEQVRIVKLLDETDELRKLRAKADGRAAALIPALFTELFGDPTHIERMRWPFKPLGEFAKVSYGLADKLDATTKPENGTRILTISNVLLHGSIDTKVEKYSVVEPDEREKARLQKFDLLFNWRNGSETHVGKTAIWEEQVKGEILHVSFLLKIRADQTQANPYFLWALINRLRGTGYFTRNARMQINRKFNASELSALQLPLPPMPLQNEFAKQVTEIRELEFNQAASRQRLDDLFQSMLHRAFNGEL
jgi:type I restriction enzyme, S subunit